VANILKNPVYIGKPRFGAQNVKKLFGDVEINDPVLALFQRKLLPRFRKL